MAAGPVPWVAVNEWAIRNHLTDDEFEELWEMVRRMDSAWLEHNAASTKAPASE